MQYRQHRLESRGRRMRRALRRLFTRGYVKTQQAYLVELDGAVVKRLVLADSRLASGVARTLRTFETSDVAPRLVANFESEVWMEYIAGSPVEATDPRLARALAGMFATVCATNPRRFSTKQTGLDRELLGDLRLLGQAGVLGAEACEELMERARALTPETVWMGHDYSDPRAANFLWSDAEELRIIDVESLVSGQLIGRGVAKALVTWMAPRRQELLTELARVPMPDFLSYLTFVELQFLASWQKQSLLQRKTRLVNPALFDRFRGNGTG